MDSELPDPLIAGHVDLRAYDSMPLDLVALFNSDTWLDAAVRPFAAYGLINLWGRAWHQVPAGSLPDDDAKLQKLSGLGDSQWSELRAVVMHGFVKCTDGRLYHDVICSLAVEAFKGHKTRSRSAKKAANARWTNKKSTNAQPDAQPDSEPCVADAREGKGREGIKKDTTKVVVSLSSAREALAPEPDRPLTPYQIANREWIELGEQAFALAGCENLTKPCGYGEARQWWADGVRYDDILVIPAVRERKRLADNNPGWLAPLNYYTGAVMDAMRIRQGGLDLLDQIKAGQASAGAKFLAEGAIHAAE